MKQILTVFAFVVLFSFSCRKKDILTKEEVIAVINKFDEGWENKNGKLVDSVLSSQYIYFTQSGNTFDRASLVKTASSAEYKLQTMERQQLTIQIEGNTAVVNTVWQGKGSYHGEEFDDNQRCSITIVKNKGKVSILSEHCTPIK
ncbi:MAG: nuclear transport factor 2 family protein [Chitinophagaceae bacterium]